MDDYYEGFMQYKHRSFEGGIGATEIFWYTFTSGIKENLWAYVGIMPFASLSSAMGRYIPTLDDLESLSPYLPIPLKASTLDTWNEGDNLEWNASGGLIFMGGVGMGLVGVDIATVANGSWAIYVEKIGKSSAYVYIKKVKLNSLSVGVSGFYVASLTTEAFRNADKDFSFSVDYSTEKGKQIYNDLIRGNIAGIQKIVDTTPEVEHTYKSIGSSTGKSLNFKIKIPVLSELKLSIGNTSGLSHMSYLDDNTKSDMIFEVYTKEMSFQLINWHISSTKIFYSGMTFDTNLTTNKKVRSYYGQYYWGWSNDNATSTSLKDNIRKLARDTGLRKFVNINIPKNGWIKYAGINFTITFSQTATNQLLEKSQSLSLKDAHKIALSEVKEYFATDEDPNQICGMFQKDDNWTAMEKCYNAMKYRTKSGISKMWKSLNKMNKIKHKNSKEFTKYYGSLGRGFMKSPFIISFILQTAGEGVHIEYIIEGTKTSNYVLEISTNKKNQLIIDSIPETSKFKVGDRFSAKLF